MKLKSLGFDEWFEEQSKSILKNGFEIARIIEVNKSSFIISNGQIEIPAELSGKFLFNAGSSEDIPTVGDWVQVQCFDDNSHAIIHDILPRKSLLKRKDPGKNLQFQLISANIDFAIIMQSVDVNFNLNRLERYLVMVNESNITPVIVLSKIDLISVEELQEIENSIKQRDNHCPVFAISNESGKGIDQLINELQPEKTYCLLGSSGVGKSSLLNRLTGQPLLSVNTVREKDSKGKHTTTRRQIIPIQNGSFFIDTPGMRELGNFNIETGLSGTFDDISALSEQCRFNDCTHMHEKGCAVLAAVEDGTINHERYKNFIKISKESRFYSMSYIEKRQRDKTFGKMIKNIMKTNRKK